MYSVVPNPEYTVVPGVLRVRVEDVTIDAGADGPLAEVAFW